MIGKHFAQYEIIGLLGKGGMGEVYRAHDSKLGRDVALKLLPADLAKDLERRSRFEREARAIAALTHPNIITIYAVEEIDGRPLLAMELIDGKTLSEVIPEKGLSLEKLLDLAIPLADAIATAHARGIAHRDLKPANVMVDLAGRIRVLDFGLAKLLETGGGAEDATMAADVTGEGRILGTASYMSPEQAQGQVVDARSDVFTLGILLYQMATGSKPFQGDTPISTITSVLRDEPVPVLELKPALPAQLGRIVKRCLEKDPERRYDTAKGLRFELETLREDSSEISAAAAVQRRSFPTAAIVSIVLLVVAAVAGISLKQRGAATGDGPEVSVSVTETSESQEDPIEAPTIVVFPFENLGAADDEYFASGIADEITTRLVSTTGLSVLSRRSSRQYAREGKTMLQIAEDLGVDYVLEGSVRWRKNSEGVSQVRVSPLLVHASDDRQIWANSYDRRMQEIFALQTEIATEVARQIGTAIVPSADGEC